MFWQDAPVVRRPRTVWSLDICDDHKKKNASRRQILTKTRRHILRLACALSRYDSTEEKHIPNPNVLCAGLFVHGTSRKNGPLRTLHLLLTQHYVESQQLRQEYEERKDQRGKYIHLNDMSCPV